MGAVRSFFAIEVTDEIKDNLAALGKELRHVHPNFRFVAKENIHLTLLFLGDIKEKFIGLIKERLNIEKHNSPVKLEVIKLGFFGSPSFPRVIWAGCKPADILSDLNNRIVRQIKEIGIVPDDTRFSPHITFARNKEKINPDLLTKFMNKYNNQKFGELDLRKFTLFKSDLSSHGPKYSVIKEFGLTSPSQSV